MSKHETLSVIPRNSSAAPAPRHDGWTPARQATFLRELASSHSVAEAARAAGMSRQSAYALRARLRGEPFDLAWYAALRCRIDMLAEAAVDRALNGVEVPHFYKGEVVGTSRKFDERLTVALLAMRDSFRAPRASVPAMSDPAAQYGAHDFRRLAERVERGPATWDEEREEAYAQLRSEYDDYAGGDWEEADEEEVVADEEDEVTEG